jgi:hypothetical protein
MDFNVLGKTFAGAFTVLALLGAVQANAATISTDNTTVVDIPGLSTFQTTGADMVGMTVDALFSDGSTSSLIWGTTGLSSGGVIGADWAIMVTSDTFTNNAWVVSNRRNSAIAELWFNGAPGLTVFDIVAGGEVTIGSSEGKPFASILADDVSINVTYSDVVAVIPGLPLFDLYNKMHVDFSTIGVGGVFGDFSFTQDTDNDERLITKVSAPGILSLFGLSLLGLWWSRRKA